MPDLRLTVEGATARVELLSGSARTFAAQLASHVKRPEPDVITFSAAEVVAFVGAARDMDLEFSPTGAYFKAQSERTTERTAASRAAVRRQSRDSLAAAFGRRR